MTKEQLRILKAKLEECKINYEKARDEYMLAEREFDNAWNEYLKEEESRDFIAE